MMEEVRIAGSTSLIAPPGVSCLPFEITYFG
jgi:hypothetical protein